MVYSDSQTPGLISALGGSLGLFTGIAIIMIFEMLELSWDIFYNIWTYMTAGGPKGKKNEAITERRLHK